MAAEREGDTTRCSKREICMCGIRTSVYGLEELQNATQVSCVWLLHPRLQNQSYMEPVAHSTIKAWNERRAESSIDDAAGLIAVSFDQRNHGSRLIDPLANEDWKSGNDRHALDMFGIIQGTVLDTSQLIAYVSSYIFPTSTRQIGQHLVCGISLGGHAAWQAIFNIPSVTTGVSVIGTPDLRTLLKDRARLSKRDGSTRGDACNSKDFPVNLLKTMDIYDPASSVFAGLSGPDDNGKIQQEHTPDLTNILQRRLDQRIRGKKFLHLTGAEDKLVPDRCSAPFVRWLLQNAANDNDAYNLGVQLHEASFSGVGHAFVPDMASAIDNFVVDSVADFWKTHGGEAAKI